MSNRTKIEKHLFNLTCAVALVVVLLDVFMWRP